MAIKEIRLSKEQATKFYSFFKEDINRIALKKREEKTEYSVTKKE